MAAAKWKTGWVDGQRNAQRHLKMTVKNSMKHRQPLLFACGCGSALLCAAPRLINTAALPGISTYHIAGVCRRIFWRRAQDSRPV